jgi:cobalt-zinc-cadmium efflux system protein
MQDHHAHASAAGLDERRLRFATLLTAAFCVVEAVGGVLAGSLALLADAAHMLTDTMALGLAWLAARLSRRPADQLRSFGYHRLQVLAAFVNGVAFFAVVAWIFYEAVERIGTPQPIRGGLMLAVGAAGLGVNLLVWRLLSAGHGNLNVRAAAVHVLGDLLGSVAAIAAAVVILATGWTPIDPLLSVLVGALILRSAWFVVRESGHILLQGTPADRDVESIRQKLVATVPEVRDIHHVHLWSLTPEHPILTLHVAVAADADFAAVLGAIKAVLVREFRISHSTIQLEPAGCTDDPKDTPCVSRA